MIPPQKAFFPNPTYPIVNGWVGFVKILSILMIFGLGSPLMAQLTTNVNTLTESAVQAAINSASQGEEVILPAGTGTWTQQLTITNNISLVGAGSSSTIIVDDIPNASFLNLIRWITVSNYTKCELNGIQFQNEPGNYGQRYDSDEEVAFYGFCPVCHVTGCLFLDLIDVGVSFHDGSYGCVDHCQFYTTNFENVITFYNGALGGLSPNDGNYGDVSFATPVQYGSTTNEIYVEDCAFWYPTYLQPFTDAYAGARVVFRYNTITNGYFQFHGTESGGRLRGGRSAEVYGNFFMNNSIYTNSGNAIAFRSGTGVIFSNTFVGFATAIGFSVFRTTEYHPPWGEANGLDPWDSNGGLMASGTYTGPNGQPWLTDSSANWAVGQWIGGWPGSGNTNWAFAVCDVTRGGTNVFLPTAPGENTQICSIICSNGAHDVYTTENGGGVGILWTNGDRYEIFKYYAVFDQPGRGQCDLIADNAVSSGQPYDTVTGQTNWPNQALEPWYQWANTNDGISIGFSTNIGYASGGYFYPTIIYGRDEIDGPKPGYTPLPFPHPLDTAGGSRNPPPNSFTLVVNGGAGSGSYTNGQIINISENAANVGTNGSFANWSGPDIANTNSASTTVTMPASNLAVTANYAPTPGGPIQYHTMP